MMKPVRGFTLVELLLAMAITAVLIVLLLNVVSATLSVWQQGRSRIDTFSNARQVLDRIADEIKGARAATNQIEFSENLPLSGGPTAAPETSENIFFVAPYPNAGSGDLCVIVYRHNGATPASAPSPTPLPYTLQRAFVDSQAAWNAGSVARYRSAGYPTLDWRTIANGILEFEIKSYSQQDLDSTASPSPTPAESWNSVTGGSTMIGNTPRKVKLRIRVVDDQTLVKLNLFPASSSVYDQLVSRAAREFTADVALLPPH